jgi:hypothetical protein
MIGRSDYEEQKERKLFILKRIKDEKRRIKAAEYRYKKVIADNKEKRPLIKKPNEGLRLTMSEVSALRNLRYHEEALTSLLNEVKELGMILE